MGRHLLVKLLIIISISIMVITFGETAAAVSQFRQLRQRPRMVKPVPPSRLVSVEFEESDDSSTEAKVGRPSAKSEETSPSSDSSSKFEAFISHRRAKSRHLAMLLKVLFERENVSAFLDVEDLKGGPFNEQIFNVIKETPNFILILSNGTLDRCKGDSNYTDFVHKEIKEAVDLDRRIILVFDDYDFPPSNQFSKEIQAALQFQGLPLVWQHLLVDQSLQRLLSYFKTPVALSSKHKSTLPSRTNKHKSRLPSGIDKN